ncbi:hypothetical protein CEXT_296641 [Caerostris extrusa]|uniref:Uncharacterized protein n=1 Tax=Caerostris extrusa TaxID=172846 RepID=A0AAV4SRI2_CAEEX|nr:hypothetical protein CEXT_296641 [Caerostris extrusa]
MQEKKLLGFLLSEGDCCAFFWGDLKVKEAEESLPPALRSQRLGDGAVLTFKTPPLVGLQRTIPVKYCINKFFAVYITRRSLRRQKA